MAGKNKGISNISYNLLNLPQQVDILSPLAEARNAYSYSADGVKLRVVKKYNSNFNTSPVIGSAVNTSKLNVTKTTDYVAGKIFENNVLDRIFVDGGYIKGGVYYFYETDHLGDNRTVINQSGTVVERNDYYPFGMQMAHNQLTNSASGSDNKRKFGNKELDVMSGLNTYDFEARPYDLNYINFWTADPETEERPWESMYSFCGNNPVNRTDPDGRFWDTVLDVAFTLYDIGEAAYQYHKTGSVSATTKAALAADALAIVIPGVTGSGIAVRATAHTVDGVKTAEHVADGVKEIKSAKELLKEGRSGKQERLRELGNDPKLGKADRGWIKQEQNQINRGKRDNIRNPPGKDLAHKRGKEAAKGYSYKHSNLQNKADHRLQHKYDQNGRLNKENKM